MAIVRGIPINKMRARRENSPCEEFIKKNSHDQKPVETVVVS